MQSSSPISIFIAGGDQRQQYAAAALAEHFPTATITIIGFTTPIPTELPEVDVLILPIHTTTETVPSSSGALSLSWLLSSVKTGGLVCGGMLPDAVCRMCEEQKLCFCDYFQREELCLANAVPTVEGILQIAMAETKITLCGSSVLVLGYGRIGKLLAERLHGLGAKGTVVSRNVQDAAHCTAHGWNWIPFSALAEQIGTVDWCCNTIPAMVLTESLLAKSRPDVLILDVASRPGGTDFAAAERLHRKTIWALGLPGKVAPQTAGIIIAKTIFHILQERGYADEGNHW